MTTSHKLSTIGFKVDDSWLVALLLMGLPDYYEPMIMRLEAAGAKLSSDAVKAKILQDVKVERGPKTCSDDGSPVGRSEVRIQRSRRIKVESPNRIRGISTAVSKAISLQSVQNASS